MENMKSTVEQQITEVERKFQCACDQVTKLNKLLDDTEMRYERANSTCQHVFHYALRRKLSVLEGVRDMYVAYATLKAEERMWLQFQLCNIEGTSDSDESDCDEAN